MAPGQRSRSRTAAGSPPGGARQALVQVAQSPVLRAEVAPPYRCRGQAVFPGGPGEKSSFRRGIPGQNDAGGLERSEERVVDLGPGQDIGAPGQVAGWAVGGCDFRFACSGASDRDTRQQPSDGRKPRRKPSRAGRVDQRDQDRVGAASWPCLRDVEDQGVGAVQQVAPGQVRNLGLAAAGNG